MSDRLAELLHQKKLLQEHINWLDQEIARTATSAASGAQATSASISPPPAAAAPSTVPAGQFSAPVEPPRPAPADKAEALQVESDRAAEAMRKADEILARYQNEEAATPDDTKRGCIILAAGLFALMAIAFGISWFFFYRGPQ